MTAPAVEQVDSVATWQQPNLGIGSNGCTLAHQHVDTLARGMGHKQRIGPKRFKRLDARRNAALLHWVGQP